MKRLNYSPSFEIGYTFAIDKQPRIPIRQVNDMLETDGQTAISSDSMLGKIPTFLICGRAEEADKAGFWIIKSYRQKHLK